MHQSSSGLPSLVLDIVPYCYLSRTAVVMCTDEILAYYFQFTRIKPIFACRSDILELSSLISLEGSDKCMDICWLTSCFFCERDVGSLIVGRKMENVGQPLKLPKIYSAILLNTFGGLVIDQIGRDGSKRGFGREGEQLKEPAKHETQGKLRVEMLVRE
ncbi:hypothetical protein NE237_018065 [Protea cynaroides]|uniref:Uncharacterized protein n=1 Tax=Protea cynaroides TaxID=273540 RepID=A0A9Q0K9B9_9MAGN|nr:hypothetical protein NE237_018065 [Protea cynaroides]